MTVSEQLDVLLHAIERQPPDVRDELVPLLRNIRLSFLKLCHRTSKAAKGVLSSLQDSDLEIKSLQFDLEVTRKERDDSS